MEKRKNRKRVVLSALLIVSLCAIFIGLQTWLEDRNGSFVVYDRQENARSFALPVVSRGGSPLFEGADKVNLEDFKGRPFLLHFWASWCNVCRDEKPLIDALWDQYKDDDLRILAVASYDNVKALQESKLMDEPRYLIALDENGDMAADYRVRSLPETLYINAEGKVLWRYKGILKAYDIRQIHGFVKDSKKTQPISETAAKVKL